MSLKKQLTRHLAKNLRRVYRYSPIKRAAKAAYSICVECDKPAREYDHKNPCVPTHISAEDMHPTDYFERMFCIGPDGEIDMSNLVGLCEEHHKIKTKRESQERAANGVGPWGEAAMQRRKATIAKRKNKSKAKRKAKRK